jgi:hypothetical protein
MKKLVVTAISILAFVFLATGQSKQTHYEISSRIQKESKGSAGAKARALKETLVNLEKQSWEAWQKRDGKFFQQFLADDHVEIGFNGITNKAGVVAGVASPVCVVKSYTVDKFQVTVFDSNTALLTYHAAQDTTCGSVVVPSPVWVSSLYVRRDGRWLNAAYQQTQTRK